VIEREGEMVVDSAFVRELVEALADAGEGLGVTSAFRCDLMEELDDGLRWLRWR
jgi:hypothetical protein